jgi:hypothetical protein
MVPRWCRNVVAIAAALVAWLVATPARASAPLCDPRGATMIAPAPELETRVTSLDAAAPADDGQCSIASGDGHACGGGHAPSPRVSSASALAVALPAAVTRLTLRSPQVGRCARRADAPGERAGERAHVDRPPRD